MTGCEGSPAKIVVDEKRERLIVSRHWKSLTCLDLNTGEVIWENLDHPHCWYRSSTPYLADDGIYFGGLYTVAKLCPKTGKTIVTKPAGGRMDVAGPTAFDGKTFFFPTGDKGVVGVDGETLEVTKLFPAGTSRLFSSPYLYGNVATLESSPVIIGDQLIFAAGDGYIYFYDKNTAALIKKISVGQPVTVSPIIREDKIIVADFCGKVCAFRL